MPDVEPTPEQVKSLLQLLSDPVVKSWLAHEMAAPDQAAPPHAASPEVEAEITSFFESGVAATVFGVVPSIVGGGILTLAIVAAVAVLLPGLRGLDLGRRMIEGPGAQPQPGSIAPQPLVDVSEAAEVERLTSGELGAEGAPR